MGSGLSQVVSKKCWLVAAEGAAANSGRLVAVRDAAGEQATSLQTGTEELSPTRLRDSGCRVLLCLLRTVLFVRSVSGISFCGVGEAAALLCFSLFLTTQGDSVLLIVESF